MPKYTIRKEDSFVRAAAATPKIRVADPAYNREQICRMIDEAKEKDVQLLVFPELCLTGYTCNDLFLQNTMLEEALRQLEEIRKFLVGKDMLVVVGLPMEKNNRLYNVAAVLHDGEILGIVPKSHIPNYSEFYEKRYFASGQKGYEDILLYGEEGPYAVPFGTDLLFSCQELPELVIALELCEDVWTPCPPSIRHAMAGATVILNASASDETTGKELYRRDLIVGQSARLICAYVYANAGEGESTQDLVFSGHNLIAENGTRLAETERRLGSGMIMADVDLGRLRSERRRIGTFSCSEEGDHTTVYFHMHRPEETELHRFVDPMPFVPSGKEDRARRCEEILAIQTMGLKKRLEHTSCKTAVIGISGGLDSTLALLVTARAFDSLGLERKGIRAVTMPCFGTTDRTYTNACELTRRLGAQLLEVPIQEAVHLHFRDIGHDEAVHDVTYENGQARERTQVLMDIANQCGGMVIGTGDMSELALGWATYNGDHMSMYGVNCSVPKTLVRHLVRYYADTSNDAQLAEVLYDVLDTPVSPELLPPENGVISQKTEDIVGPYELHDFFLYYVLRFGYRPGKIYRMARAAFQGAYTDETIKKWLGTFYRRFFAQQFKRSCLPDGPKVGSVAVSPRGDLRMPSDASRAAWMKELEELE